MKISVTADIAVLAEPWHALETSGLLTPYQRFAWVNAYARTVGRAHDLDLRYVMLSGQSSDCLALFPLEIVRQHGARIARFIGDKHANYHMPVFDRAFAAGLTPDDTGLLLRNVAVALGDVDALVFTNQPETWDNLANPLARIASWPSPSDAYKLSLMPDCEATLARTMSTHARKKLKNKRHRLADFGSAKIFRAVEAVEVDRLIETFMAQKAERFAQLNIVNPFDDPAMRDFIRRGALDTQAGNGPAIELYGFALADSILSVYVGAVHNRRFSGMATAYAVHHPAARTSPGEIFLVDLIKRKCREGYITFDLGVGEARYKTTICDDVDHLFDTVVAVTVKGRVLAGIVWVKHLLKRTIKQNPTLLRIARLVALKLKQPVTSRPKSA